MRHQNKNLKIVRTSHGGADGVKPTSGTVKAGSANTAGGQSVPEDIQKFVDGVPGKELRNTLLQHALMLSTTVAERDGVRRYADGLKAQNTDLQNAYQSLVSNQRLFVATAAMQGLLSHPNVTSTDARLIIDSAINYAEEMFTKLFPETPKPTADASPKSE